MLTFWIRGWGAGDAGSMEHQGCEFSLHRACSAEGTPAGRGGEDTFLDLEKLGHLSPPCSWPAL